MFDRALAPARAVEHIEAPLSDSLTLSEVAGASNYSKFHLHRRFSEVTGMTMGDYICRRLTEGAKMLVFTDWSVLDIAVSVGFGSQQAFSAAFKRMFKKTPGQYRSDEEFWPLQARLSTEVPTSCSDSLSVRFAVSADENEWMSLLDQVVSGYPHLDEKEYKAHLRRAIARHEALVCMSENNVVGALAFGRDAGTIDFLGVMPQLRGRGIAKMLLRSALDGLSSRVDVVSTTTFREGDAADTGWRAELLSLAFAFASLLASLFAPEASPVRALASEGLTFFSAAYLFAGMNIFASAAFTAFGNGLLSAIVASLRTFGLVPLCLLLLPQVLGIQGVWVAVPVAEAVTLSVAVALIAANRKRYGY